MRIVIDLQGAQSESRSRGIGRYSLALGRGLARLRKGHEVYIALNDAFPDTIEPIRVAFSGLIPQDNICVWSSPQPTAYIDRTNEERRKQAEVCRAAFIASLRPDWVIVSSLFEGFAQDAVTSIDVSSHYRTAVILYDLIPLIHAKTYLVNDLLRPWYLEKIDHIRRANLLLSISASSGKEALDYLGFSEEQVVNISTAADEYFQPLPSAQLERDRLVYTYGLVRPFIMYTGGIDYRKNIERLIEAYALLPKSFRERYQLAIVCSIHVSDRERLTEFARKVGLVSDELILTGFVPEEDLLLLYNICELFVFPSWHEGFGLPALEAMQCGKPVIASNRSSLPEVIGREDALFDPYDVSGLADKIRYVLSDKNFRTTLSIHGIEQAKKFSWDETARRAWAALEKANIPRSSFQVMTRPRLAYVSPLPPEQSGIADYSAELIRDLTRWYQIDVVLRDPDGLADATVSAVCGVISIDEFRSSASRYSRVLYHFGNSEFHEHMFSLLSEIPGVVVLHDFFLSGIQAWSEDHQWRQAAWARALLLSHGYSAVAERFHVTNTTDVVYKYPANLTVLQDALGVIVHSDFSRKLAQEWYGSYADLDWRVVPHLRVYEVEIERRQARARLGLAEDSLVVCSFGILGPTKLNHRLLDAWFSSKLESNANVQLVFVGLASGSYGAELERRISEKNIKSLITITGWADSAAYHDWLSAADIAVQLRTLSRGETSGTVLDCMNHGVATIVNSHGSLSELDPQAVWILPECFSDGQLIEALETLVSASEKRLKMGAIARDIIREMHNPRRCAELYADSIETLYSHADEEVWGLMQRLAAFSNVDNVSIAQHLACNHPPQPHCRQLLVDISELVQRDSITDIQRVVRAILHEWLLTPPGGLRVEPVYAKADQPGYHYARSFTCRMLGIPDDWIEDELVDVWPGDIFVGLDLQPVVIPAQASVLQTWHRRGVHTVFIVYDLLPILLPDCFPPEATQLHTGWLKVVAQSDSLIAISASVANELKAWLDDLPFQQIRPIAVDWFHLGADVDNSLPSKGFSEDATSVLGNLRTHINFLMVGTIEPRKGHEQVLKAFEQLWKDNIDVNLTIVGKQGWMVEDLIERIRAHQELNKRLFWLFDVSDEYLESIYAASTCLIAASYGEGFGLPLIEAAQHRLPIFTRDIPVFREVAGEHAYYFNVQTDHELACQIKEWLALYDTSQHPKPDSMCWLTWKKSAEMLGNKILGWVSSK